MEQAARAPVGGERIGNYEIVERAGAGGMGVVYKARDLKLQRTVALKFLPHGLTFNAEEKERFFREARSASQLDHPNIGIIHGLEESEDGQFFIVMAYYEGQSIERKLRNGPIPPAQAVDFATQIARGLAEAHSHNIVHRDIKPSNVMINQQGTAKIVDFGLARALTSASATHSVMLAGTAAYLSPEQAMGKPFDHRADIWALGVTFTEMLTGRHPFQRDNLPATIFALINDPPAGLDSVPADLQPIVYRALAKNPALRYQSCNELIADLEPLKNKVPAQTEALTASKSKRRSKEIALFAKRATGSAPVPRRWPAIVVAGLLLLLAPLLSRGVRERVADLLLTRTEKHIAVLPFDNIGRNPANDALVEGLMDSLTSRLSNLDVGEQSLWVVPSSLVRKRKIDDPVEALHDLGANYVVKGSVQGDGRLLRLTLNLINTKTLRQEGSFEVEDAAGDMSTLQNEAVSRLAKLMNISVTPEMLATTGGSVNPKAYESYLKALGMMQRYDKAGNLDQAISALDSATKSDPRFALGFAQMAEAYRLKNKVSPDSKSIDQALVYAGRSLELNDRLPAAYVTLGRIHEDTGKHELAIQEFDRALQMDPRNADALNGLGHAYEGAGRIADAEKTFLRTAAMRPDYWDGYNTLALFYDRQRRYDESIANLKHALELTPDNAQAWLNLGAVYLDTGDAKRIPDAEAALKKSIELGPSYAAYANLGFMLLQQQRFAESAQMSEKALQMNSNDPTLWENVAQTYDKLGQAEKATAARDREIALLVESLRTNPRDPQTQAGLASLYAQRKLSASAMPLMQAALASAPDDPYVLAVVGEAFENLGDRKSALKYVQKAVSKGYQMSDLERNHDLQALLADPAFRPARKKQ